MSSGLLTSAWQPENFYDTTLSQDMTDSSLEAFLTTVPVGTEGTLIIDPTSPTNREIIYFNSKTALKVNIPANGRGYDNTTATPHTAGTRVIMGPIADWFNSLRDLFTTTPQGWTNLAYTPNTVTYLGNRSYECVFNGVDLTGVTSNGMRLRTTRTVTAPTKCTSLNGTNQYYSKSSPAGMTFTDDFTMSAWVKLSSYSGYKTIQSRFNGTSGWEFSVNPSGQLFITAYNGGAANQSSVTSYQSLPLNKWVHVAGQLDMSAFTATTTTSYLMIDGVDVPSLVARGGTNPSSLIQAGDYEVGAQNGATNPFPGKIAQAAVFNAKVTQATMRTYISQGLAGTETSLISAYSFNNSINDLNTTNANNLTANGSAVATNADSWCTQDDTGTPSGTTDYAIVTKKVFSTNTTLTVQVPEGCTIPTSGGVSAVSYSSNKVPYGFPSQRSKWKIECTHRASTAGSGTAWQNLASVRVNAPVGEWKVYKDAHIEAGGNGYDEAFSTISSTAAAETDRDTTQKMGGGALTNSAYFNHVGQYDISVPTQTDYYLNVKGGGNTSSITAKGDLAAYKLVFENAYI